jgi:hypothetical protein
MMNNAEELARILRRMPRDRFTVQALAILADGGVPDAELLRRCGIRVAGSEIVA